MPFLHIRNGSLRWRSQDCRCSGEGHIVYISAVSRISRRHGGKAGISYTGQAGNIILTYQRRTKMLATASQGGKMKECCDTGLDFRDGEDVKKICTKTAGHITAKGNGFDESGYPAGTIPVNRSDVSTGVSARGFPAEQAYTHRHHGKTPCSGTGVHDICPTTAGNLYRD